MPAFLNELKRELLSRLPLILWATLSLLLVATGPFGTYAAFNFWQRMLIWLPVVAGSILFGSLLQIAGERWFPKVDPRLAALAITAIACLVIGPLLNGLILLIVRPGSSNDPGMTEILLVVGSWTLGLCALRLANAAPPARAETPAEPEQAAQPVSRLLQRMEPDLRGQLLWISVRDHYVDVKTTAGQTSLLMRLVDAIAETDPNEGAQVHRSHWVAWACVESAERTGGKVFLRLTDGQRLPVSKSHYRRLEERGLL